MTVTRVISAIIVSTCALALMAIAPARAADPLGTWLTPADSEKGRGKIRIENCGGAICGKLVWLEKPIDPKTNKPKLDENNVDASKQSRPLLGIPIVLDMKPAGDGKWEGHVYNSRDGQTYSGSFTMTNADTAELKGCVMGGLICKGETWTRSN